MPDVTGAASDGPQQLLVDAAGGDRTRADARFRQHQLDIARRDPVARQRGRHRAHLLVAGQAARTSARGRSSSCRRYRSPARDAAARPRRAAAPCRSYGGSGSISGASAVGASTAGSSPSRSSRSIARSGRKPGGDDDLVDGLEPLLARCHNDPIGRLEDPVGAPAGDQADHALLDQRADALAQRAACRECIVRAAAVGLAPSRPAARPR